MARGDILTRQWNLLKALQRTHYGLGLNELVDELGCGRRQVQRDLQVLLEVGFPIECDIREHNKKFWKLSPDFITSSRLLLTVTEMLSLIFSQKLAAPLEGTEIGDGLASAIDKIRLSLAGAPLDYFSRLSDAVLIKGQPFHNYSDQKKEISILNKAIHECHIVRVTYAPASKDPFDALLHPYGLVLQGAGLYCVGKLFRNDDGAMRNLKISRIKEVETTAKTFPKPDDFSLEDHLQHCFGIMTGKPMPVKVKLTGWAATSVREQQWHESQKILEDAGDYLIARYRIASTMEFKRWLLGYGRHAVVISPESLAAEIAQELEAMQELYEVTDYAG